MRDDQGSRDTSASSACRRRPCRQRRSRRIERATHRDIAERFIAANLHPDHDTIAVFRRISKAAFAAAFPLILLLARQSGLLRSARHRSTVPESMPTPRRSVGAL
jgi:hypothetical protein